MIQEFEETWIDDYDDFFDLKDEDYLTSNNNYFFTITFRNGGNQQPTYKKTKFLTKDKIYKIKKIKDNPNGWYIETDLGINVPFSSKKEDIDYIGNFFKR